MDIGGRCMRDLDLAATERSLAVDVAAVASSATMVVPVVLTGKTCDRVEEVGIPE
jgi:hypothetical protein